MTIITTEEKKEEEKKEEEKKDEEEDIDTRLDKYHLHSGNPTKKYWPRISYVFADTSVLVMHPFLDFLCLPLVL